MAKLACSASSCCSSKIGWTVKRQTGSHKVLAREGWPDFVFAFHDREEIGPRMLARVAKRTGLEPSDFMPNDTLLLSFIETQNMSSMRWITESLRDILLGSRKPTLEEEAYPRDALGRPELQHFTKPVSHYAGYIDDYLDALVSVADSAQQSFAYRKGVVGQWGVIARGPAQGLPYVLRLIRNPLPEGRSAAASILDAWSDDPALTPHLIEALATEPDIETLSTLMGTLGRLKVSAALPRLAELLRSPNSDRGDLSWSVIEALSAIVGERFMSAADPKGAADIWLLEHGY